jgi:ketosteroid isomerase-like protein
MFQNVSQSKQDLTQLFQALKSGDMDAAKEAYAAFQQDSSQLTPANTPFWGTRPSDDLQALKTALDSGNKTDALKALHTLRQDVRQIRRHHIMYHEQNQTSDSVPPSSDPNTDSSGSTINVTA